MREREREVIDEGEVWLVVNVKNCGKKIELEEVGTRKGGRGTGAKLYLPNENSPPLFLHWH